MTIVMFLKGNIKMKKIAIASILALSAVAASAVEVGVTTTRDDTGARNATGITVGNSYGRIGVTAGFERFTQGANDQDRYSLVAGYNVAKFGAVTITPKVGAAYLSNQRGADGYAMTVGVGASMPLTKKVTVGIDYARQYGQDRVQSFDGDRVTAGVTYRF
jgi:opacity protein-like surface antigen